VGDEVDGMGLVLPLMAPVNFPRSCANSPSTQLLIASCWAIRYFCVGFCDYWSARTG
jgi:hypothetical protein